jgi:hypothetical protein
MRRAAGNGCPFSFPPKKIGASADMDYVSLLGTVTIRWRPVVFVAALFWFWYLAPVAAASLAFSL